MRCGAVCTANLHLENQMLILRLKYRTPNPSNSRQHWRALVAEKHKAQDALTSALRSAESAFSMSMPNTPASNPYSMLLQRAVRYRETGRIKSRLIAGKKRSGTSKRKKR